MRWLGLFPLIESIHTYVSLGGRSSLVIRMVAKAFCEGDEFITSPLKLFDGIRKNIAAVSIR